MSTISFFVYTPEGVVIEETISSLALPGVDGEIGILPLHREYIGLIGTGLVHFITVDGEKGVFAVNEGFCTVSSNKITLLADQAFFPDDARRMINKDEKERIKALLFDTTTSEHDREYALKQIKQIEVIEVLATMD